MKQDRILIIGAGGQIGAVLTEALREVYQPDHVIAADLRDQAHAALARSGLADATALALLADRVVDRES